MTLKYDHLQGIAFTGIGKRDCYELMRDFYRDNFSIELPNMARPHNWEANKIDLFRMHSEALGFEMITDWKIKDLRPGDVFAIMVGESNPNHLAVFLGDDTILHHLYGRFSKVEPFSGFWRNHISFILRHPDVPDLRPVYPDVDILELIRARTVVPASQS